MGSVLKPKRRQDGFAELQARVSAGDQRAAEELAEEFLAPLISFAARRGAADPEGVAHVALLWVLQRLDRLQFKSREQMWAYLCQTARSRTIDEFRATKPVELVDDRTLGELIGQRPGRHGLAFDEHVVERGYVDELLSPLTGDQRQVLEMRFIDDLSIAQTADRTGKSQEAVKGLQRRAIHAIIAAAAALLALGVLFIGGDGPSGRTESTPAEGTETNSNDEQTESEEGTADQDESSQDNNVPDNSVLDNSVLDNSGRDENGQNETVPDRIGADSNGELTPSDDTETSSGVSLAAGDTVADTPTADGEPVSQTGQALDGGAETTSGSDSSQTRFTVTTGTAAATDLNLSGPVVAADYHGTRVYCTVSHFAAGGPVIAPTLTADETSVFWGNVTAAAGRGGSEPADSGNSTCEGGINDRSAYWMPALFDRDGQVVLPEQILVEYKAFGGPGFDRATINPIPLRLEMTAGMDISSRPATGAAMIGGGIGQTSVVIRFPQCLATDDVGLPIAASPDQSHLHYGGSSTPSGCPQSHPYRIPQVTYKLDYAVPFNSGWSLSSGVDADAETGGLNAGFVSGWDAENMDRMVRCTIELIGQCEFAEVDGEQIKGRSQLPERFNGPDGTAVYQGSVSLAPEADRTPFGTAVPQRW